MLGLALFRWGSGPVRGLGGDVGIMVLGVSALAAVGVGTPVVVAIIAYAFFGLDAVGEEIEEPFGTDANDLPLTQLSTMIEIDVRGAAGEADLPAPARAVDHVLA